MAEIVILVVFILFLVLMVMGFHIHGVLLGSGIVGILLLGHADIIVGFLGSRAFRSVASYSLSTIPLFVLTAQFIMRAGIVENVFSLVYNTTKGSRSLLGTTTLVIGGLLGAVSGSGVATSASLGQIAYPELVKHGYNRNLAAAVSAAAGSLSSIIPPSVVIIVYGVITETPIGRLFIGAILPGVAIIVVYILVNLLFLKFDKKHKEGQFQPIFVPKKQKILSLSITTGIIVIIFGGIYSGTMTPTEAGGVAAFAAFIGALFIGKVNKEFIIDAAADTLKVTCMIMLIIIGASIFGRFVSFSMAARKFIELLGPLMEFQVLILAILLILYFFLFMFIEGTAVIVISTPILIPIMRTMGVDTLWFGILVCFACTIGMLTPPLGLCVYSVSGSTGQPVEGIFKYGIVFAAVATLVVGTLLIAFPGIVTWLPSRM